jgi:8-oxo-dGTP diphosphatase
MSNNGRLKVIPSVFAAIIKDGKVLLLRRQNTGWLDGYYDLPAGHLEDKEKLKDGAARELEEEAGIKVVAKDLKLFHIHQNHHKPDAPHYGFMFLVRKWNGQPKLMEPEKSDDIRFFGLDNLPEKITPYVKEALEYLGSEEVTFSYHEPDSIKTD